MSSTTGFVIGLGALGALVLVGTGIAFVGSKKYATLVERNSDDFRTPSENENKLDWGKSRNVSFGGKRKPKRKNKTKKITHG